MESIDQIKIEADSDWLYTNLAALFDNPSFMEDVRLAREELSLKELIPHEQRIDWGVKELEKVDTTVYLGRYKDQEFFHVPTKSEEIANRLCKEYSKPPLYSQPISEAILCGEVRVSGKTTAYPRIIYPQVMPEDAELAIIITPETRLEEIRSVYKRYLPAVVEDYKRYVLENFIEHDTRKNIRRDRSWYWLWKSDPNLGYGKIAKENHISKKGAEEAIKSYIKLINSQKKV